MNIPSPKIRPAIVGATGMVGGYALRYALDDLWACTPVLKKSSRHLHANMERRYPLK
jgi:hypothetical protein